MSDPKHRIASWLIQKRISKRGPEQTGKDRRFVGVASIDPRALGDLSPLAKSKHQRLKATPNDSDSAAVRRPEAMIAEALLYAQSVPKYAPLTYDYSDTTIRNLPITDELRDDIQEAVYDVYGPEHSAVVHSGGQYPIGKLSRGLRRIGTSRHDSGQAADLRVIAPDGRRVRGEELARLGQYWLANRKGSVGLEMPENGIHLDQIKDQVNNWDYASAKPPGVYTRAMHRRIQKGLAGQAPDLYKPAPNPKPGFSAGHLGLHDPQKDPLQARMSGRFGDLSQNKMIDEAMDYLRAMPVDPYARFEPPVPKSRPQK